MEVIESRIPGAKLIKPKVFDDERGFFMATWNARVFAEAGSDATFVQGNHSRSVQHTQRGLHYQIHQSQGKLVRVTAGSVLGIEWPLSGNGELLVSEKDRQGLACAQAECFD